MIKDLEPPLDSILAAKQISVTNGVVSLRAGNSILANVARIDEAHGLKIHPDRTGEERPEEWVRALEKALASD